MPRGFSAHAATRRCQRAGMGPRAEQGSRP
jgi:hypothetical protein